MSTLTTEEQEVAAQLKSADLGELAGMGINMQKLGFKDNAISEAGVETHDAMTEINNTAYKVMKNRASDLSKAKAKMSDIAQRYGRDNDRYDSAQSEFNSALAESNDAELRHNLTKNTKKDVGDAMVSGLTF